MSGIYKVSLLISRAYPRSHESTLGEAPRPWALRMRPQHFCLALVGSACATPAIEFRGPYLATAGGVQNVEIEYRGEVDGELSLCYDACDMSVGSSTETHHHCLGSTHVGRHPLAKRHEDHHQNRPTRFVWMPPEDTPDQGCLHAIVEGKSAGTAGPFVVQKRKTRRGLVLADVGDALGPWFDGVAYLQAKQPDATFVAQAKSKSVAIVGAGMSGLMTSVCTI